MHQQRVQRAQNAYDNAKAAKADSSKLAALELKLATAMVDRFNLNQGYGSKNLAFVPRKYFQLVEDHRNKQTAEKSLNQKPNLETSPGGPPMPIIPEAERDQNP